MKGSDLFPVEDHIPQEMTKLFNRTEETLMDDVKTLKEWMKTQNHLPEVLDEDRIKNFLLLNKCSIEKSKQKIDMYYTIRTLIPDMFEDINPKLPRMKLASETMYFVPLSKLTEQMYRVFVFKIRNKDLLDKLSAHDIVAYILNFHEVRMKEDYLLGDLFFVDLTDVNWNFLVKFTPMILAKMYAIYERVYSVRMKGFYFINSHPYINTIVGVLKTLIKPKLFQRIHVCDDLEVVYRMFPKEMLPRDYGGLEKSCEELHEIVNRKFDEHSTRFDKLDVMRVDENLRPQKLINDEILGFYGNFKKLEVD